MFTNATQDTFVEYDDRRNEHDPHFTVPATIGPEDGRHLFSYLGVFLTYITPRDLHVGTIFASVVSVISFKNQNSSFSVTNHVLLVSTP